MLRRGAFLAVLVICVSGTAFVNSYSQSGFGELNIEQNYYEIPYSGNTLVKLYGTLGEDSARGNKLSFTITNPNGDKEEVSVIPSKDGHFENYLVFNRNSVLGDYVVRAYSYDGNLIGKVLFELYNKQQLEAISQKQVASAKEKYHTGIVSWDLSAYFIGDPGYITLEEPDLNQNSNVIERVFVQVTSDTDSSGIQVELEETGPNTGVFSTGEITFDAITKDFQIRVTNGDRVYVEYEDTTIPSGGKKIVRDTAPIVSSEAEFDAAFSAKYNPLIPSWIKTVAGYWCEDKLDDSSFCEGIKYFF